MTLLPPAPTNTHIHRPDCAEAWAYVHRTARVHSIVTAQPRDASRRAACEFDFLKFCLTYCPDIFQNPNAFHEGFAAELQELVLSTAPLLLRKALAAPRGAGKTTLTTLAALWAALYGHIKYGVIFGPDGGHAAERIANIKSLVLNNDRLHEDFPEITGPVRKYGGDPRSIGGAMPGYPWSTDTIRLANGTYLAGRGIETNIAGMLKEFNRPDFILLDDLETVDSVKSAAETENIRRRVEQEIVKLPGQRRHAVMLFICTIKAEGCLADQYTNRTTNPEWRGEVFSGLVKEPTHADRWDVFMECLKPTGRVADLETLLHGARAGLQVAADSLGTPDEAPQDDGPDRSRAASGGAAANAANKKAATINDVPDDQLEADLDFDRATLDQLTPQHRTALKYYLLHRTEMDDGGQSIDDNLLPLHALYYERATLGEAAFACEIQNKPLRDENLMDVRLNPDLLMKRQAREPLGLAPAWAAYVFVTIDEGARLFWWEVSAWDKSLRTSQLIDFGSQPTGLDAGGQYTHATAEGVKHGLIEEAIHGTLEHLHNVFSTRQWPTADRRTLRATHIGVDCQGTASGMSWMPIALKHCAAHRPLWIPLRGTAWKHQVAERAGGRNWICELEKNPAQRVDANANYYKSELAHACQLPHADDAGRPAPGARRFGADRAADVRGGTGLRKYAKHQAAEKYVARLRTETTAAERAENVGWVRVEDGGPNHWFDCAWMQYLLADLKREANAAEAASEARASQQQAKPATAPNPRDRFFGSRRERW